MSHSHNHGGSYDHNHSHVAEIMDNDSQRRVRIAVILVGGFRLVEVVGGVYSRSLVLLADAGHMLSDFVSMLLAWMAFRAGNKKPDLKRSYWLSPLSGLSGVCECANVTVYCRMDLYCCN